MDLPKKVVGTLQPISLCIGPSVFILKHSFNPERSFGADKIELGFCHHSGLVPRFLENFTLGRQSSHQPDRNYEQSYGKPVPEKNLVTYPVH